MTIRPKTALVTGAAGFIGSHLVDRLITDGFDVYGIDDLSSGKLENLPSGFDLHVTDIRGLQVKEIVAKIKPDLVFHLAAQISVAVSAREPQFDADVNVGGSLNLLEGIRSLNDSSVKLVYVTSGGTVYGEPTDLPADELSSVRPLSPYAASKLAVETYLPIYERLCGLDHAVIRLGNVYGPRQDPHGEAGVVAIFAQAMLGKNPLKIFGTGTDERDYVYVDDVVEAVVSVSESSSAGPFNIATGIGTNPNRIFEMIADLCDYEEEAVHVAPRDGDIEKIYLDISKAKAELGWSPRISLKDGLKTTVEWFRNQTD